MTRGIKNLKKEYCNISMMPKQFFIRKIGGLGIDININTYNYDII